MAKGTCRLSAAKLYSSVPVACEEEKRHEHQVQIVLYMYSFLPSLTL